MMLLRCRRAHPRLPLGARRLTTGLSIRHGPTEPALLKGTIPEHFASIVSRHGDRPAVIARSPSQAEHLLTYRDLDASSNRLARSLSSLGVRKGDRVAVSLGNCIEFAALTYAVFKLGAVLVPLNPTFNAEQVQAALTHLAAEALVINAVTDLAYKPGRGRSNDALLRQISRPGCVPSLKTVIVVDNLACHPGAAYCPPESTGGGGELLPYDALLGSSDRPIAPDHPLLPTDTVNIQFTSGTTSLPKAAMLTHANVLNNGALIAHRMHLLPSDRVVVPPPLFHCFGSVLGYMATATTGAALLLPSPAFDPLAVLSMAAAHHATGLYGVSTMFISLLEALHANPHLRPRHLTKGIVAGSSVPEPLMKRLYDTLGLRDLVICYGMTETSPVSCMTSPHDPFAKRCSSVGTVMPHTAVKIVDPSDRTVIQPLGVPGELAAAGYLVMKGYFNDPQRTSQSLVPDSDGLVWMYSGDEARMDQQGYVYVTGRIKELIIRAGENIHPLEIESCLFQLPGVQEVAVAGVPDERLGEAVAAFIIPEPGCATEESTSSKPQSTTENGGEKHTLTQEMVRSWVNQKLSAHLVPKHVFWVSEYPKTASGKIQKFKLSQMATDMLQQDKSSF